MYGQLHPQGGLPIGHPGPHTGSRRPEAYSAAFSAQHGFYQLPQPSSVAPHGGMYGTHHSLAPAPVPTSSSASVAPSSLVSSYRSVPAPVGGTGYAGTASVSGYSGTASLGGMYAGTVPVGYGGQYGSFPSTYGGEGALPTGGEAGEQSAEMTEALKKSEEAWREVREQRGVWANSQAPPAMYGSAAAYGSAERGAYMSSHGGQPEEHSGPALYPSMSERYSQLMSRHGIATELDQIALQGGVEEPEASSPDAQPEEEVTSSSPADPE